MSDSSALSAERLAGLAGSGADDETAVLIRRCLQGEEAAFAALYDAHSGMVYRLSYSLLQNQEDAEEVLQDSFEYAFRRLSLFDSRKSSFKTWLYRITISRCRNKRRRKWLPTFSLQLLSGEDAHDPRVRRPDEVVALSEQQQAVWRAIGDLSLKLREVAILRYFGGMPYAEIGLILGIPAKTAESRMRLAHKALRQSLQHTDDALEADE